MEERSDVGRGLPTFSSAHLVLPLFPVWNRVFVLELYEFPLSFDLLCCEAMVDRLDSVSMYFTVLPNYGLLNDAAASYAVVIKVFG
jgi:hypothetical protein